MREGVGISRPYADDRKSKRVLIVAGEASADLHGSNLVRAMKRLDSSTTFWGIGGKQMEEVGVKILIPASDMAVVGLTEVLSRLHRIAKARLELKNLLKNNPPHLLILIDYPGFNIHLAGVARRYKVPVLYYISPQVWAWRTGRVKKIARRVDRMAVILPFEEDFYRKKGVDVEYVGHPLLDSIPNHLDKDEITQKMGLENAYPVLGLLPGSRNEEIRNLLPIMVKAVEMLSSRYPYLKCILPIAATIKPDLVQSFLSQSRVEINISPGDIYETLTACDLALVTSGTATLETAIMGVPMILVYRVSPLTFWVGKMVIKVPHLGLANLVAGESIIPELIQNDVTPDRLTHEALEILECGQKRENMIQKLGKVKEKLGGAGASERTAKIAMEMMTPQ
ncbi:MAG: lipid-A-disaccharide synthase [Deltaproteobacteria bacterium]|nr:MAG: lipid-A-disaccharide synthase [Deltaproteobacteria bacterium]